MKKMLHAFALAALCISPASAASTAPALPVINELRVEGSATIPQETILHRLPYKVGGVFDSKQSNKAIEAVYSIDAFSQVVIEKEALPDNKINLFITVTERPALAGITFLHNKELKTDKLEELLETKDLRTIDQETADLLALKIKKEYRSRDFHEARVTAQVTPDPNDSKRAFVIFTIEENRKSYIRHIDFIGNTVIPSRKIRAFIQNRERWIFGFLNDAGKYDPAGLEIDKERVKALYMNEGYYNARVTDTLVKRDEVTNAIDIIFTISEGACFTIEKIEIPPDAEVPHRLVRHLFTLQPGDVYKHFEMHKMMESIKKIYGEYGYIDAIVSPQIIPNTATNSISILFHVDRGTKWHLNRLIISGNESTRDLVIRRQMVALEEGQLITSTAMEVSKHNVEYLSYFDREKIEWRKHRVNNELLDLELHVKEVPTREFNLGMDFGASQQDPNSGVKGFFTADLRNLFGRGLDAGIVLRGSKKNLGQFTFHITDPYLLNNLSGSLRVNYNKVAYEHFTWVEPSPTEQVVSLVGKLGTRLPTPDRRTSLFVESGIEHITNNAYERTVTPNGDVVLTPKLLFRNVSVREQPRLQSLLEQKLQVGTLQWVGVDLVKDTRNHTIYPNEGYHVTFSNKLALPGINKTFSFLKSTLDASWYTPLIGFDTLVLGLHAFGGFVQGIGLGESSYSKIPYKELFHIGGDRTLRGFEFSQAGPSWAYANPLGGKQAVCMNAELIFPFMGNRNMRVHLFYDTGCAWNTPKTDIIEQNMSQIRNDNFHMRHTIGVGLNILSPQPMKISFGYKLDRNTKINEAPSRFHIGVNSAF